jgi:hypothetical protein
MGYEQRVSRYIVYLTSSNDRPQMSWGWGVARHDALLLPHLLASLCLLTSLVVCYVLLAAVKFIYYWFGAGEQRACSTSTIIVGQKQTHVCGQLVLCMECFVPMQRSVFFGQVCINCPIGNCWNVGVSGCRRQRVSGRCTMLEVSLSTGGSLHPTLYSLCS